MYLPEYKFEWNEGMYQNAMINNALEQYVPSGYGVFKQSASYAFNDSSFFHVADYLSTLEPDQEVLTEEQWRDRGYNESGVQYKEGITDRQAQILQERVERDRFYGQYMQHTSMLSVGGIAGMVVGSLPDPINYIPFVGWAGRFAKVARIASKMPILAMSANAMLGQATFEAIKQSHYKSLGKDVDWTAVFVDIGIAGTLGAGFGGIGKLSGLSKSLATTSPEVHQNNLAIAATHIGDQRPVEVKVEGLYDTETIPQFTIKASRNIYDDPLFIREQEIKTQEHAFDSISKEIEPEITPLARLAQEEEATIADTLRKTKSCQAGLI